MIRKRYAALLILLVILSLSLYASWHSRRAFGDIVIEKQDIVRSNGRTVSFRVYQPSVITYGEPLPAVLTIHGISSSGAMMDAYNIELARRNFTVVSVDLAGHGRSAERFGFDTFFEGVMDAYEAVRYVQLNDPETSDAVYGVLGHSLGAGVSLLFNNMTVTPSCTVIIGGGMGMEFGGLSLTIDELTPKNLMIASGIYDELVTQEVALDTLRSATGLADPIAGVTYGNFTEGTARRLVFSLTNHLFEMSDSEIVTESVDWLGRSLQGEGQVDLAMLDPSLHVYNICSFFDLIASISFVFTIFPIVLITYYQLPDSHRPRRLDNLPAPLGQKAAVRYSLVVGMVTAALFLLLMLLGFVFEFAGVTLIPVSFGTALSLISLMTALVVVWVTKRFRGRDSAKALMADLHSGRNRLTDDFIKTLLVLLPTLLWIFAFSFIARVGLDNGVAFTFAVDSGAAVFRFVYMMALVFLMLPIFYTDTLWLNSSVGTVSGWSNLRELMRKTGRALFSRLIGFAIVIASLYLPFLAGVQLGFVMFIALLMLPFAALFGLTILVTVWVGGITRTNFGPALMNAILFAIVITSTFQLV